MADRRASSRPGDSYLDDGYYRPIEQKFEQKYGLPVGLLGRIRKDGEKTNRGVVSSAGARSVYQIIPPTAKLFQNKYGVNAYSSDEAAAQVAALHLKESWDRSDGNIERTVREYHGGPNPKNWGRINDAYARRVTGKATARSMTVEARGTTALAPSVDLASVDVSALRNVAPSDIGSRKPLGPRPITERDVAPKPTAAGSILAPYVGKDATPGSAEGTATEQREAYTQSVQAETARAGVTFGERLEASWDRNWITSMVGRALESDLAPADPEWSKEYVRNIDAYEKFAETQEELDELRGSTAQNSREDFYATVERIQKRRETQKVVDSNGTGWAYDLTASLTDPTAWVATAGVSKGVNAVSAFAKGVKAASAAPTLGTMAAEGAIANLGFTGILDASGEKQSVGDYVMSGALGVGIGAALHGVTTRLGKPDASDRAIMDALEKERQTALTEIKEAAQARVGANADDAQIEQAMQAEAADRATQALRMSVSERADNDRLIPADEELWRTTPEQAAMLAQSGPLGRISDPTTRRIGAELQVRAEEITERARAAGDLDKGLEGRVLQMAGQESDALTMLRSNNPMLQATAIQLLESTTGAGGRKPSAALTLVMRQRAYMEHMVNYDQAFDLWRQAEGKGKLAAMLSPDHRAEFDRLVFREVEARGGFGELSNNGAVRRAADAWEAGMDKMRREMQEIGTLGAERLGNTSVGYMSHQIDAQKLRKLTDAQRSNVENIFAQQFRQLNEYSYINEEGEKVVKAFDAKFSKELAKRYIYEAIERSKGATFVPANLQSPEAVDIISDAIKTMQGIAPADKEALLGKFSRGGAKFTKKRLRFDLTQDIGEGRQLGDLFNQDLLTLYRNYSRRVAGEVALGQYGVLGKQTLDIMRTVASVTGATDKELAAFERVSSEFLNQPWRPGQHDNAFRTLRSITSSSMLGGMGITQLGELGNALPVVGVKGVLAVSKELIPGLGRLRKEIGMWKAGGAPKNPILADFDEIYGFIGGDDYAMTRLFDAPEGNIDLYDQQSIGHLSKAVRAGSHFTAVASGFRVIHAVQQRGMAEQLVKKAIRYIHLDKESTALADMGINEEIRSALKANMDKIATFDKKGNLTGLNLLGEHGVPARVIHDFAQALERGAGQIIQKTYIGETGPWAHSEFLKMLLQFRTFGITSIEKQYGRNRANYGAIKSFGILLGAMSFAFPIHMARVNVQAAGMSRAKRDEFLEERTNALALARATMQYTSVSGLAPDALDLMSTFGSKVGVIPKDTADTMGIAGRPVATSGLIPVLGMTDKVYKGTVGADFDKLRQVLPGANLPFVTPIINGLTSEDE